MALKRWTIDSFTTSGGTEQKTLITAPSDKEVLLLSMFISNTSATTDANVSFELSNGATVKHEFTMEVPAGKLLDLNHKMTLEFSDVIKITSDVDELSVMTSGMEF